MGYQDRFMHEYQNARVNLTLTEEGYERYIVDMYPDKLAIVDILLHASWILIAIFFASRTSEMSFLGPVATSLGGMLFALILGRFLPLGILFGGPVLLLGIVYLPYHVLAGPIGLYGFNSISKYLSKWYGKDLVKRWCVGSEKQFIRAVEERSIVVAATRYANEDTKLFLKQLVDATDRSASKWEEA